MNSPSIHTLTGAAFQYELLSRPSGDEPLRPGADPAHLCFQAGQESILCEALYGRKLEPQRPLEAAEREQFYDGRRFERLDADDAIRALGSGPVGSGRGQ